MHKIDIRAQFMTDHVFRYLQELRRKVERHSGRRARVHKPNRDATIVVATGNGSTTVEVDDENRRTFPVAGNFCCI